MEPEFRRQWQQLDFRFCCEDCVYLDPEHDRCVHGWPSEEHRLEFYRDPRVEVLVFCKEFELR
jgi:hypothetical protein